MTNIPLYTAIGLVAISLAARAEDLSTATAPLPPGEACGWMPFSGLPDGPFRWGIVQRQNRGL